MPETPQKNTEREGGYNFSPCALLVRIYGFFDFQIVLDGPNMVQMVPNFLNPFYIFCYISVPKIGFQDPS